MIEKYLLLFRAGGIGTIPQKLQRNSNADQTISQRKGSKNQGDHQRQLLAAQNVGNPGGKQVEYHQEPELGISRLIEP